MIQSPLAWSVGFSASPEIAPVEWVPAEVPGAVQLDWARAHDWEPWSYADNWRDYLWMEDVYWTYRAQLVLPDGPRRYFVCGGVDYRCLVRLNGVVLHEQEGMFTPFEIDLTERAADGDTLEVVVFPAPKSRPAPADRVQANQSCKPAVSYGWDFHPRLIPLGIWEATYLEARPACHLRDAEVRYTLTDDFSRADVAMDVTLSEPGAGRIRWQVFDRRGVCVIDRDAAADAPAITLTATLDAPELWWPNGQGDPVLYTSRTALLDGVGRVVREIKARVGFRTVRLVMHPTQWDEPRDFPKSRSTPPITLEINGRRIFAKGANWVSPHVFPGEITAETYRPLLELAQAAHMNLLRLWGGAIIGTAAFYEECDARGIMLWQEFPLACNRYEGTPAYLRVLDRESRTIITRLRRHPSVVLWCGGNELFNVWSGMTEQDLPLRLLNRNCYDLDPARPFLYTSPLMGMGHGHYVFRSAQGREVYQIFANAACTAYTEFGCGGPASVTGLREIIPPEELFPPRPGTAWETHHAVAAWEPNSHLLLDVIEDYFGPCATLEQLVERGQLLQAEGLKCLFEEARRQWPQASMALNWCFNEPWPTAANMSIVGWPAEPKPAYYAVAGSLRPALASARLAKYRWRAGDLFAPELWLLNDSPYPLPAGRIEASIELDGEETFLLAWDYPALPANTNLAGPIIRHLLPAAAAHRMVLRLRVVDHPEMDSAYILVFVPSASPLIAEETRRLNA